jgi:UDPglucose--hexose-1-phosphate uridylyltransferase
MSELRHDPLSGHDVIVAAGRAARPVIFAPTSGPRSADAPGCPFCVGSESETPPEVARTGSGAPDRPGWRVRVFPNLYPIIGGAGAGPGATGAHEVIALSAAHGNSLAQLDDDEAIELFTVMRDRVRAHLTAGHAFAFAIVNHLRPAGASIEHPHAQVFALDFVPAKVDAAVARVRESGRDLVRDDAAHEELAVTGAPDGVAVWCPHASTSPYLTRIAHERGGPRFDTSSDDTTASVAVALRDVLARLDAAIGDPPYNVVVHGAPPGVDSFHWYVEVVPRLSVIAGFEQATGILVNSVPPDQAARTLNGVDLRRAADR